MVKTKLWRCTSHCGTPWNRSAHTCGLLYGVGWVGLGSRWHLGLVGGSIAAGGERWVEFSTGQMVKVVAAALLMIEMREADWRKVESGLIISRRQLNIYPCWCIWDGRGKRKTSEISLGREVLGAAQRSRSDWQHSHSAHNLEQHFIATSGTVGLSKSYGSYFLSFAVCLAISVSKSIRETY